MVIASHEFGLEPCRPPTPAGTAVEIRRIVVELNAAQVRPGQVVIVMGVGGIGINAVQGAKHAGAGRIIAVDPVEFKRESALKLGATDAVSTMIQATDLAQSLTNGQGADSAIVTVGVATGEHVAEAFASIRKDGIVVLTAVANIDENNIPSSAAGGGTSVSSPAGRRGSAAAARGALLQAVPATGFCSGGGWSPGCAAGPGAGEVRTRAATWALRCRGHPAPGHSVTG